MTSLAVSLDDQERINEFSVLNIHNMRLQKKISGLDQKLQNYQDAQADLDLQILEGDDQGLGLDDDQGNDASKSSSSTVPFKVGGSVFFHLSPADALTKVESQVDQIKRERATAAQEKDKNEIRAATLKRILYAKFGDAIRLEPAEAIDEQD